MIRAYTFAGVLLLILLAACAAPEPPVLRSPVQDVTLSSKQVHFTWEAAQKATMYALEISRTGDFSGAVTQAYNLTRLDYDVELENLQSYYWRVRAKTGRSDWGSWSQARAFWVEIPLSLRSPRGAITDTLKPTFTWGEAKGAVSYHLQISVSDDFRGALAVDAQDIETHAYPLRADLLNRTGYSWRLRVKNAGGKWGRWSLPQTCLTNVPEIYISPEDAARYVPGPEQFKMIELLSAIYPVVNAGEPVTKMDIKAENPSVEYGDFLVLDGEEGSTEKLYALFVNLASNRGENQSWSPELYYLAYEEGVFFKRAGDQLGFANLPDTLSPAMAGESSAVFDTMELTDEGALASMVSVRTFEEYGGEDEWMHLYALSGEEVKRIFAVKTLQTVIRHGDSDEDTDEWESTIAAWESYDGPMRTLVATVQGKQTINGKPEAYERHDVYLWTHPVYSLDYAEP